MISTPNEMQQPMENQNLSERLKKLRAQNNLSVKQVCLAIQVPETTYREWEMGRMIKGHHIYAKLASLYKISLHELLTGDVPEHHKLFEQLEKLENEFAQLKKILNQIA